MALKTAKMFKDFFLTPNNDNTAVKLSAHGVVEVSVKNDNFANQITIKDNGVTDFYSYKYITFDNSAIFEITDVIKNDNFYTVFIKYVTNITFDEFDEDFYADAVSVDNLQRLGVDISTLFSILGKKSVVKWESQYSAQAFGSEHPFLPFVKIRLSECPQNLSIALYPDTATKRIYKYKNAPTGKAMSDAGFIATYDHFLRPEAPDYELVSDTNFCLFDSAFTVILPLPYQEKSDLIFHDKTNNIDCTHVTDVFTASNFLKRLNALITDLTLSVEIVLLAGNDCVFFQGDLHPLPLFRMPDETTGRYSFIVDFLAGRSSTGAPADIFAGSTIRDIAIDDDNNMYPIFCMCSWIATGGTSQGRRVGMGEVFQPQKLFFANAENFAKDTIYLQMKILGNIVDLSECRNNYVVLTRGVTGMRIYTDFDRRIFFDIQNSLEYTKDAYSNYEAYKKANIELVQSQEKATLRQQQEQAKKMQNFQNAYGGISASIGAARSLMSGNVIGAAVSAISTFTDIAAQNVEFNIRQENERANMELRQQQQRELARDSVIPGSDFVGSLEYPTFSVQNPRGSSVSSTRIALYTLYYITIDNKNDFYKIEQYIYNNTITDKITAYTQDVITRPLWQTLHPFYQVKLKRTSPLCNKKDCIIFVEDDNE